MKRTPLTRTASLNRGKRVNPVSDKRKVVNIERERNLVEAWGPREDWKCEWTQRILDANSRGLITDSEFDRLAVMMCYGSVHAHEIVKRSQGGSITDPANCAKMCSRHNGEIENIPELAHRIGLVKHAWGD